VNERFDPVAQRPTASSSSIIAIALAIVALLASGILLARQRSSASISVPTDRWARIKQSGILRAGYGGYPPYTIISTKGGSIGPPVTGFSVDLVNAIASRTSPALKVEWHQFSFDTMKPDLDADRFDFIADPVFMTIPRTADFAFSVPYSYFGIAVGLVRANENRFKTFSDLDRPGVTIVLAEGWTSSDFARANLKQPTLKSVPVTGDATSQLDEVLTGRADVALNDVPTVLQYVRAHPGQVKALWLEAPPSSVAGAFVMREGDERLRDFLTASIQVLQADGTIDQIDKKWRSLGFFPSLQLRPGAGIRGTGAAQGGAVIR
jgi:ABC-type amino acid transport substrate-binding protein